MERIPFRHCQARKNWWSSSWYYVTSQSFFQLTQLCYSDSRYDVHPKLVGFMAPVQRGTLSDISRQGVTNKTTRWPCFCHRWEVMCFCSFVHTGMISSHHYLEFTIVSRTVDSYCVLIYNLMNLAVISFWVSVLPSHALRYKDSKTPKCWETMCNTNNSL